MELLKLAWTSFKMYKRYIMFYILFYVCILLFHDADLCYLNKFQIHSLISNKRHFIKVSEYLIVVELNAHVTVSNHTNRLACGLNDLSHVHSVKMQRCEGLVELCKVLFPMRTWFTQESGNIFHEDRLCWGKKRSCGVNKFGVCPQWTRTHPMFIQSHDLWAL